jgi:MFS family permease
MINVKKNAKSFYEIKPTRLFRLNQLYELHKNKKSETKIFWKYVMLLSLFFFFVILGFIKLVHSALITHKDYLFTFKEGTIEKEKLDGIVKLIIIDSLFVLAAIFITLLFVLWITRLKANSVIKNPKKAEIITAFIILVGISFISKSILENIPLPIYIPKVLATVIPLMIAIYSLFKRVIKLLPYIIVTIVIIGIFTLLGYFGVSPTNYLRIYYWNQMFSAIGDGIALLSFGLLLLSFVLDKIESDLLTDHILAENHFIAEKIEFRNKSNNELYYLDDIDGAIQFERKDERLYVTINLVDMKSKSRPK